MQRSKGVCLNHCWLLAGHYGWLSGLEVESAGQEVVGVGGGFCGGGGLEKVFLGSHKAVPAQPPSPLTRSSSLHSSHPFPSWEPQGFSALRGHQSAPSPHAL